MAHEWTAKGPAVVRPTICATCVYRRDLPAGVWCARDWTRYFMRLRQYDLRTADQPHGGHLCHHDARHSAEDADSHGHRDVWLCHGWAVVHSSRGPGFRLLSLAFDGMETGEEVKIPQATVPLFDSAHEAVRHALRTPDRPEEAKAVRDRLTGAFPHIAGLFSGDDRQPVGGLAADLRREAERWSQLVARESGGSGRL